MVACNWALLNYFVKYWGEEGTGVTSRVNSELKSLNHKITSEMNSELKSLS